MRDQSLQFAKPGIKPATKLVLLCIVAIALIFLDNRISVFNTIKSKMMVLVYPAQYVASRPAVWFGSAKDWFRSHNDLVEMNRELQKENFVLRSRLSQKDAVQNEINELKSLLYLTKEDVDYVTTAEVVSAGPEPFLLTMILNKGTEDGVQMGQAVVNGQGFVGQITAVQPHSSQVSLLQSQKMTIPVMIARTGVRTLIYGEQNQLNLKYFPTTQDLQDGDVLVTSGMNDHFPSGIPIATVKNVRKDSGTPYYEVDIDPLVNNNRIRYVLVMPLKKPLLDFQDVANEHNLLKEQMEKQRQFIEEHEEMEKEGESTGGKKADVMKAKEKAKAKAKAKAQGASNAPASDKAQSGAAPAKDAKQQ